jgi:TolA-binding protein
VRGSEGASFEQQLRYSNGAREEVVLLEAGTLRINVRKLVGRDRFLVVCGEEELEVRGTRFEVNAEDGRLVRVRVTEGLVEVRPSADTARMLRPGDEWHRPRFARARRLLAVSALEPPSPHSGRTDRAVLDPVPASEPSAVAPTVPKSSTEPEVPEEVQAQEEKPREPEMKKVRPANVSPKTPRQDVEATFLRAWQLYKRGKFDDAAELFLVIIDSGDEHDIVEDALFLRCSALESAGHTAEAIDAAERYARRFPNAVRREAVGLRRAWLELARGNPSLARTLFTALLQSTKESVRKEAQAGLDRVNQPAEPNWLGDESD